MVGVGSVVAFTYDRIDRLAIVVLLPAPLFSGGDSLTAEIGGQGTLSNPNPVSYRTIPP